MRSIVLADASLYEKRGHAEQTGTEPSDRRDGQSSSDMSGAVVRDRLILKADGDACVRDTVADAR